GSATWLGKKLLSGFLVDTMPEELAIKFYARYSLDKKQIMERVYRQANPSLFLSSFADFIMDNREHPFINDLIEEGFSQLFEKNFVPLRKKHPSVPINFSGSMASDYEDVLRKVAHKYDMDINVVLREPINHLLNYYINKNK